MISIRSRIETTSPALAAGGKFLVVFLLSLTAASLIAVGQPAHAACATLALAW